MDKNKRTRGLTRERLLEITAYLSDMLTDNRKQMCLMQTEMIRVLDAVADTIERLGIDACSDFPELQREIGRVLLRWRPKK